MSTEIELLCTIQKYRINNGDGRPLQPLAIAPFCFLCLLLLCVLHVLCCLLVCAIVRLNLVLVFFVWFVFVFVSFCLLFYIPLVSQWGLGGRAQRASLPVGFYVPNQSENANNPKTFKVCTPSSGRPASRQAARGLMTRSGGPPAPGVQIHNK